MANKKKAARLLRPESDAPNFTVVLEDLRAQFGVFGEALSGLRDHVNAGFSTMDRELGLVKSAVLENSRGLSEVREGLKEVTVDLRDLRHAVEGMRQKVEGKADRTEVVGIVEGLVRRSSPR